MQDNNKPRSITDIITKEPDLLRRCALINFNMDVLESPEDALLSYKMPAGFYEKWAAAHYESLINRVASATGADPEQIADKEKRTPEQEQALIEAAAREQITRLEMVLKSNYIAAIKHINAYCIAQADAGGSDLYKPLREEQDPAVLQSEQLVNVPLAATLYFFATHDNINPQSADSLTAKDKGTVIKDFNDIDVFYREHRAELHTEQELLRAYIASVTPNPEKAKETLEQIKAISADKIKYPLDKVNSTIWGGRVSRIIDEIVPLKGEKSGSNKKFVITYSIDFEALDSDKDVSITKRLEYYDKRIFIAAMSLIEASDEEDKRNNTVTVTLTQIYHTMGNRSRPGKGDLERINASLTKMRKADVSINNEQEAANYNYPKFVYKGSLLPFEQVDVVVNGQLIDSGIHFLREPPLMTYAKQHNQLTAFDPKMLQSPISKTEKNLAIDDYLIKRIKHAKAHRGQPKILYKTMFAELEITDKKQRSRAIETAERYLKHYQSCNEIARYTMDADSIKFYFARKKDPV